MQHYVAIAEAHSRPVNMEKIMTKTIIVEPYNPKWETDFNKAKAFYSKVLNGLPVQIEHVGSTAVKGLAAKPVLDIDILVNTPEKSREVIRALEGVGYIHKETKAYRDGKP